MQQLEMRYRALVEYDGTGYFGFQKQRNQPTIQDELEQSINRAAGEEVNIIFAGRTDSGVHALGQVISFKVNWKHGPDALEKAINAGLPADISIREVAEVDSSFHPRFDAKCRQYRYYIYNHPVRSPRNRLYSWHVKRPLELELMNKAAEFIVGQHDFAAFGQAPQGENTTRTVYKAKWHCQGHTKYFDIEANAFLYRMVRSLVGAMKHVGERSWKADDFFEAMTSLNRSGAGQAAPAHGLFLMSVSY